MLKYVKTWTRISLIVLLGWSAGAHSVHATSLLPAPADRLVRDADIILIGECAKVTSVPYTSPLGFSRQIDTWTFHLQDVLKGDLTPGDFSWKQMGDRYEIGKSYLLFLSRLHDVHDLMSPVGKMQGSFEVRADGSVVNRLGNQFLLQGIEERVPPAQAGVAKGIRVEMDQRQGAISLESMKALIRSLKDRVTP